MHIPDELGVNIYTGNIVDDASDLQLGVLKNMAQQGGFTCKEEGEPKKWWGEQIQPNKPLAASGRLHMQ